MGFASQQEVQGIAGREGDLLRTKRRAQFGQFLIPLRRGADGGRQIVGRGGFKFIQLFFFFSLEVEGERSVGRRSG